MIDKILNWLLKQYTKFDISVKIDEAGEGIVVNRDGYLPTFIWCNSGKYIVEQFNLLKEER